MKAEITAQQRPADWAVRMHLVGVPNLHRVTPVFFRSAQPSKTGFAALAAHAVVKTVVSLRAFHSDRKKIAGTPLALISIPINTWNIKQPALVRALAELEVAGRAAPALLHCQHGADRSGLVVALYRMAYQGWDRADALDEMRNGHFGYHAMWGNIPAFIAKVDIDALRQDVVAEVAAIEARNAAKVST